MSVQDLTVGEVGRRLGRYGPYLALVATVSMVVAFAPGEGGGDDTDALAVAGGDVTAGAGVDPLAGGGDGTTAGAVDGGTGTTAGGGAVGATDTGAVAGTGGGGGGGAGGTTGGGATSGSTASTAGTAAGTTAAGSGPRPAAPGKAAAAAGARNCDAKTGRVTMPTLVAVDCVPSITGSNGGATYKGVTADKIRIAVYRSKPEPTADAIAAAGGSDDSDAEVEQQYREWLELYASTLETYGRKIELVFVPASGAQTDDAAARADALKVAQLGVFASLNAPNTTYVNELAARGILCISCAVEAPSQYYLSKAPYVWNSSISSTWKGLHSVEIIAKYTFGKKAQYAGDPLMREQTRKFALVSYDTPKGDYKLARDAFVKRMKERGMPLAVNAVYNGYPDTAKSQQQARPIIQKLKDAGITTVLFSGDPFAPIFFTQEATRQQYFPEWNASGPLVDTSFFARLYDQQQWRNQFSVTNTPVRLPEEKAEADRLLQWYFGRGPTAPGTYNLIKVPVQMVMEGIHYAGPNLTPQTYAAGLFKRPIRPTGKTFASVNYGDKIWPAQDYTGVDDLSFIWWDADAVGEDETGNRGVGLYRYENGGSRYQFNKYPATRTPFNEAGTVTFLQDYPAGERPPDYPRPKKQ